MSHVAKEECSPISAQEQIEEPYNLDIGEVWIDSIVYSRAIGITVEGQGLGSPADEGVNRWQIKNLGNHLYFPQQHRNVLHRALLAEIQGHTAYRRVSWLKDH